MLLYFPLLYLKLFGVLQGKIRTSSAEVSSEIRHTIDELNNSKVDSLENTKKHSAHYVYLKRKSPITAGSVLLSVFAPIVPSKVSTKSRLAIFVWTIFSLIIPGVEALLYYTYLYDHTVDLAKSNITTSWTTVMLDWEGSHKKLHVFGGQYIALGLYLTFGWVIMLSPKIMADVIYCGIVGDEKEAKHILSMTLERKETLGSMNIIKHRNGYLRLYKLQICHIYMLVNYDFWKLIMLLVKDRWCSFGSLLKRRIPNRVVTYIISVLIFPIYIIIGLIEIILIFTFYVIPLFSFISYILKGFGIGLNNYLVAKCCGINPRAGMVCRMVACGVMIACFVFHLYIFTLLFMHSFIFLARILMFTFTALVAYPSDTYGYFMLFLLSVYFGLEGVFRFGDIYKLILKAAVKLISLEDSLTNSRHTYLDPNNVQVEGISRELFEYLVEKICPRRVQILHTLIKLVSMIFVLSVSIILMERFKKFE